MKGETHITMSKYNSSWKIDFPYYIMLYDTTLYNIYVYSEQLYYTLQWRFAGQN